MTVKQGEAINNQFTALNDSVKSLLNQTYLYKGRTIILTRNLVDLDSNYKTSLVQLDLTKSQLNLIEKENQRLKNQIWSDKKWRLFTTTGILFAVTGWVTLFVLSTN